MHSRIKVREMCSNTCLPGMIVNITIVLAGLAGLKISCFGILEDEQSIAKGGKEHMVATPEVQMGYSELVKLRPV